VKFYRNFLTILAIVTVFPFGAMILSAKEYKSNARYFVEEPHMKTVLGTDTAGGRLFKRLHDETSKNGTFVPKPYDQAKFFMYSKSDVVEEDGALGVRDMYSGRFMEGVSGCDACHVECKDANGDGKINYDDLADEDRAVCIDGTMIGNKPVAKCKAGPADLNWDGASGDFINAEHLWPKSAFGKKEELIGDLHNLRPSFSVPNASRASNPYAPNGWPIYPQMQGDVARAIFYFALTYYDRFHQGLGDQYFTKSVPTLMQWNRQDPPDEYEKKRNDLVAGFQGNRNPFVDNPEYVDQIGQQIWQKAFKR